MQPTTLLPGTADAAGRPVTLGVMGGGQLGRMFVQAAQSLGYCTAVLDPDPASPAGQIAHVHIQTGYLDEAGLARLAAEADAITTEFENVPAQALRRLAALRAVAPSGQAVAVCQDRAAEKAQFVACGVPCAPHALIETQTDLASVPSALLPGILKTARLGYDGKGQVRVDDRAALAAGWRDLGEVPCVLEQRLPLLFELSLIVVRDALGNTVNFPLQQNLHRDGILAVTSVPAPAATLVLQAEAEAAAARLAAALDYVGVLCVEFFIVRNAQAGLQLVANEMAPRPHNSGHYTLDACDHSQFALQVRALAGLPLVAPRLHSPSVMLNLLGDLWFDAAGRASTPDWSAVLALPGAHLHLYGKHEARRGRKMGHLTLTAASADAAHAVALQAAALLGIAPF
jgi:5-(carboxyamino)imidazole ribonucleotide synthase